MATKSKKQLSKTANKITARIPWWAVIVLVAVVMLAGILVLRFSYASGYYTCWSQGNRVSNYYSNSSANTIVVNGQTCTAPGYK